MTRDGSMRRAIDQALIPAGALLAVMVVLVGFDARVRDTLGRVVAGGGAAEAAAVNAVLRQLANDVALVLREQGLANVPLLVFVAVATVLMAFMVRT